MNGPALAKLKEDWAPRLPALACWLALILLLAWSYSGTFYLLVLAWWQQPDYGHGFFVPIFALILLLVRGEMISGRPLKVEWERYQELVGLKGPSAADVSVWIAAAAGAVLLALLYWLLPGDKNVPTMVGFLLAAMYGAGAGLLVFLAVDLFRGREHGEETFSEWSWWAMGMLAVWLVMRLLSGYLTYQFPDNYSILPLMLGLALFVGGWRVLHWAWPSIVFLFFMIPLPGPVATRLRDPLQTISAWLSVGVIQTIGVPAYRLENMIKLPSQDLEVAEACSGLRMTMLFFAVCTGAAFVMRRPLWERIVVVVSAVPIAVLSNVVRVSVTAGCHEYVSAEWGQRIHDAAGLFMMPVGLLMLFAELTLLSKLFVEPEEEGPLALGGPLGGPLAGNLFPAARRTGNDRNKQP